MRQNSRERPSLFFGFRLRHALVLLICLGLILVLAGYFAVSAGTRASLESVIAQGRALTETLISSAEVLIETDREITAIAIENLIGDVETLGPQNSTNIGARLDDWRRVLGAERLGLVINRQQIASSFSRQSGVDNNAIAAWLDSLEIDPEADIIYDFHTLSADRILFSYFPLNDTTGLFAAVPWKHGQYGNEKLGLYNLLNEVGQESGIEYIVLQNQDGIIFASKKVASLPKLSEDPFLIESLRSDTTRSRLLMFQDREVLESVRIFRAGEFDGIFRVGLSLYGYRQIAGSVKRQVWLVVVALIMVGMLAFAIITGFQNYEFLKAGFQKSRVISQSLLDSIPGPVVAVDSELRITDINAMARNRFGISQSIAASSYLTLFPDDPFHFRQVMESRRSASVEKVLGEDRRQYFMTTTPLVGFDGNSIGAIAVAQDITDTRKLESMAESRRRLSELGALAASMAHEIRNPLNAIGITIQRMKNEVVPAGSEEEYRKFIELLRSEIKRLNDIIEKFLAVARAVRPEIGEFRVIELVGDAIELFENQARMQGTKINLVPPADDLTAEGDRAGLSQVLINLIKNSLEALEHDGEITIDIAEIENKIRISVIDNGPGIMEITAALKPFYTTKNGGTGLGLATASKIMADHGGELVIESSPGKGCRIDLLFPKRKIS
jgi:signal transduction histidine kinase